MKRIFLLILALLLVLSACGNKEPAQTTLGGKVQPTAGENAPAGIIPDTVTLYCLVQEDVYSGDVLSRRYTYEYNDSGDLIEHAVYYSSVETVWNEEYEVYEYVICPADDVAEYIYRFCYDRVGNITEAQYQKYEDGKIDFDVTKYYSYDFNELGEITYCDYTSDFVLWSSLQYDFTYQNGKIINVDVYATDDGKPYGDSVQNYQFDYDEQGRLVQESFQFSGSYEGFFQNRYTYDDRGQIASIEYTGNGQDGEYSSTQNFTRHANQIMSVEIAEADEDLEECAYYNSDQFLSLDSKSTVFQKDEHGNVIVALDMQYGVRREYTYQVIEVSHNEAQRYYRRWHMLHAYPVEWEADSLFYYPVFFYHLIPNPIW